MKKNSLNEGWDFNLTDDGGSADSLLTFAPKKKKKRKSVLQQEPIQQKKTQTVSVDKNEIPDTDIHIQQQLPKAISNVTSQIIIPQSIVEDQHKEIVETIEKKKKVRKKTEKKDTAEKTIKKAGRKKKVVEEITQQKVIEKQQLGGVVTPQQKEELKQQIAQEVQTQIITPDDFEDTKEVLEEVNNVSLDNVDVPEVVSEIGESLENIPDGDTVSVEDIEITPSKVKKTKEGYFKVKVNIKKNNIPEIVNKIASYVKVQTKGLIKPRVCDLRVIGNTNKTQLRNSSLKLATNTIVFKPDHTKLKVNKGTRFMISIPEDFGSTGNILVYLQESRAKTILEITGKDFVKEQVFVEFIGDRIAEYYYHGYEVTLKRLQLRGADNPLMQIISSVLNTREYKAKPHADDANHIFSVSFISNGEDNQWLQVRIDEIDKQGEYNIVGVNTVTGDEYQLLTKYTTLRYLEDNIITILNKAYSRDWSKEIDVADTIYYQISKLTHRKLRTALVTINNMMKPSDDFDEVVTNDNFNPLGIEIRNVLSKADMKRLQKNDYDAESIIGKTSYCDLFVITYLAYPIIGGDKRAGRNYITRQQYYQKYNVSDRRQYQLRNKTVLAKEGTERNYNARIYMFQIEYIVNGKRNIYRSKSFEQCLAATQLFTEKPDLSVKSEY